MTVIGLIVAILIFALIWYLIGLLPIDLRFKRILYIVFIILAILYLLSALGPLAGLNLNTRL
jgi:hypothetical protein